MRFAVISDLHLGDPICSMVNYKTLGPGEKYDDFIEAAGQHNDFLVLLGDTFDFSITDYATAHKVAKAFFIQIQRDRIAKNIIYITGNHDFDMWHTLEQQTNIIYQIERGRPAREFQWSVPGLIDDRSTSQNRGFQLPGVIDLVDPDAPPRVKMFVNNITKGEDGSGAETNFYFAYPNLYFVNDDDCVLFTHGHYFEAYWTMVGEWAIKVAGDDLGIGDDLDLRELVALNFPLCHFGCCGVGQAGPLTGLIRKVRQEVKDKNIKRLEQYLDRLDNELDEMTPYGLFNPKEWGTDMVSRLVRKKIIKKVKSFKYARFSDKFIQKKSVMRRFCNFYDASRVEIGRINEEHDLSLPLPHHVVFGHTHQPIMWGSSDAPKAKVAGGRTVDLFNTGGWLWKEVKDDHGAREFCGAQVLTYQSDKGFVSHSIT